MFSSVYKQKKKHNCYVLIQEPQPSEDRNYVVTNRAPLNETVKPPEDVPSCVINCPLLNPRLIGWWRPLVPPIVAPSILPEKKQGHGAF